VSRDQFNDTLYGMYCKVCTGLQVGVFSNITPGCPDQSSCHCSGPALPGGNRNYDGGFNNLGNNANFWSASANDATNAWNRNLNYNNDDVNRNNNYKRNGFSVRCLQNWSTQQAAGG